MASLQKNKLFQLFTKSFGLLFAIVLFSSSFINQTPVNAATIQAGDYIKGATFSAVYYVDTDTNSSLQRHAFINEQIYFTWQNSFANIITVSDNTLASLPLSTPVLPKSGVALVKIQSDNRTYAVANGQLRWITTEQLAIDLYGPTWANLVIDLPPTIFPHFTRGSDLAPTPSTSSLSITDTQNELTALTDKIIIEPTQSSINPFTNTMFYVDPNSDARQQVTSWTESRPADATAIELIASQPVAKWFGDWNTNIETAAYNYITTVTATGALPIMVAYNIPNRDCGSYSSGGTASSDAYRNWITDFSNGIAARKAIVILEPDATAASCLTNERLSLLADAVTILKSSPNTAVYIDAGHANWIDAATMASRLTTANIAAADGFALNVSNYYTTNANTSYGTEISNLLGGTHFIIDTGRNGHGSNGEWCNPTGRHIGQNPTTNSGNTLIDALLWVKQPGDSDGSCNNGPSAGSWWANYALSLVE